MNKVQKIWRLIMIAALLASALNFSFVPTTPARADSTAQALPFSQNWTNTSLITTNDDWSGVPGINGYLGQNLTAVTGIDPQTVLAESVVAGDLTVLANQALTTSTSGDVGEFEITDSVVAFQGSGTADAPYILISVNTTGKSSINISYNLRDIDGTVDNAIQPVALQYRVGSSGNFTNVPAGFVADASTGPSLATLVTPINVTLPGAVDNQALVQIRVITTNAVGSDEWVGIDDISVTSGITGATLSIGDVALAEGNSGTTTATFTVSLSSPAPVGGVTFDIATANDTATIADNDYVAKSVIGQSIAEGSSSATFDVTLNGDTTTELDETFFVNVTNAVNATITDGQAVGTITNDDNVLPVLSINDATVTEGNAGTILATFTVSLSPASASAVTFDIATVDNTATVADNDYLYKSLTGQTIIAGDTSYTFDVTVNGDLIGETDETFYVNVTNASVGVNLTDGQGLGTITNDDIVITPTYTIQGSGSATPLSGIFTTEGVVVGDYEGGISPEIRGFYIQDPTGDANPATSDGLFVYNGSNDTVALGQMVRVTGTVSEYISQTQISATSISMLSSGNTVTPTDIVLPFGSIADQEKYEGMLVRVPQTLYVTEMYLLGRFGQVTMSGTGKLYQPTNVVLPGAPALAMQAANDLNQIIVDDASQAQNPDPILFGRGGLPLSASNTLRGGDTIAGLVGVVTHDWAGNAASPTDYRIRPINAMGGGVPNFIASNARPTVSPVVGGTTKAVGMNLLNYFNTFADSNTGTAGCFPGGGDSDCRGANSAAEFTRQSDKTVNAIITMNADVIGIVEMENDGYGADSAIQDLVNKLNVVAGAGTYAFINPDTANGALSLGTDAIKVGILYKPAALTPVGNTVTLNTIAFVNAGTLAPRNRASLLQAFQTVTGERFLFNVNHLKSKGSCPALPDPNADQNDGQSCWNPVRTIAVGELLSWFATNPTGTGDLDLLIVGDLNSYAKEDPIKAFETAGYTNTVNHFGGAETYSYVFDGQWGYLDYAIASPSLLAQTTNAVDWHINSDEPTVLDYNVEFKTPGQVTSLYSSNPFRISDHDPVMAGLGLNANAPDTQINTHPAVTTVSTLAEFTFSSPDPTATFECSRDAALFTACVSPVNYSGLIAGAHNFQVRAKDTIGNTDETPASFSWTIDLIAPTVSSSILVNPNPTNLASVNFTVTFSEAVSNVDAADFTLTATGTVAGAMVTGVTGGPTIYNVSVDTGTGSGNLRVDVVTTPSIQDLVGNALVGPYTSGDNYVVDKIAPVVSSSVRVDPSPTDLGSVNFTVTFSESVNNVDLVGLVFDDFTLTTSVGITGASVTNVSGSGTTYTVTVNTGSGNGTIRLNVGTAGSIVDTALNPLVGSFSTGQIYSVIKAATFADVPLTYWSNSAIERLYFSGITSGCTTVPLNYCPVTPVTRAQMAIFLLRGIHGSTYTPPAATGTKFNDVPINSFAAAWIEQLAVEGITSGCGGGNYCPATPVSRAQMAIFLVRARHGIAFIPPTATGIFTDVPITSFGADYIEQLFADGITTGCGGNNFCPATTVKRDSMAVFLVRTFNLP